MTAGHTLEYKDLAEATTPEDGYVVYANRWWVVNPEGTAITFARFGSHRAPQCNHDVRITRSLTERLYPDHGVMFVPVVYLPREDC